MGREWERANGKEATSNGGINSKMIFRSFGMKYIISICNCGAAVAAAAAYVGSYKFFILLLFNVYVVVGFDQQA